MVKLPYKKERFYVSKDAALREAKRLRKTRSYNAKVLPNLSLDKHFRWVLWTQRISDRP